MYYTCCSTSRDELITVGVRLAVYVTLDVVVNVRVWPALDRRQVPVDVDTDAVEEVDAVF